MKADEVASEREVDEDGDDAPASRPPSAPEPRGREASRAGGTEDAGPRPGLVLFALLLISAVVYAPSLGGPFLWDDRALIDQSARVKDLTSWASIFTGGFWSGTAQDDMAGAYFRPLSTLSFAIDYALHEGNPAGFHLTNVALHLGCVALLFGWLRAAGLRLGTVALATSLWALAPRLAECVAWISGRTDVLAGLFSLGALRLWAREGSSSRGRDAAACALLFAGLLSKEVALAAVLACVVHAVATERRVGARALAPIAVLAGYVALRANALAGAPGWDRPAETIVARATVVLEAVGRYAVMVVDAWRPRAQIGFRGDPSEAWAAVGGCVLVALAFGAARLARRPLASLRPDALAAGTLAFVGVGLVVHVVAIPVNVVAADRFLYVPLLGAAYLGALAIDRWVTTPRMAHRAIALGIVAASAFVTFGRAELFADDVAFWSQTIRESHPSNRLPHSQLAVLYAEAGMDEDALALLELSRGYGRQGPRNHATQLLRSGRCAEAGHAWRAIEERAPSAGARTSRVRAAMCVGALAEARRLLDEGRGSSPADARLRGLEEDLAAIEGTAEPLPEAASAEARVRRATWLTRSARRPEANAAWLEVARADDASTAQIEDAAVRLLRDGPLDAAAAAAALARARGAPSADALVVLLEEREARVARLVAARAAWRSG